VHGGRFYSRFSNRASDDRERLMIDGLPVVTKDFDNLHGRLSFAVVGEACPEGDLYALDGFERKDVKAAWVAALNANNGLGITSATDSKKIVKALRAKYPSLSQVFGKGFGLQFQRADAEVVRKGWQTFGATT
jgi:hypothetical protein